MKIKVVYSQWGADGADEPFTGGVHDVDANPDLLRSIAGAEASGVVEVLEATDAERAALDSHVQSQEDGEAANEAAVEDGSWSEGNLIQYLITAHDKLAAGGLSRGDHLYIEQGIADAKAKLEESGSEYDLASLQLPAIPPAPAEDDTVEVTSGDVASISTIFGGEGDAA